MPARAPSLREKGIRRGRGAPVGARSRVGRGAIGLVLAAVLVGPAAAVRADDAPPAMVVVAPAMTFDLKDSASFSGRVTAMDKVDVVARVTGFLDERLFTEGARVARGDVLYRIEDDDYRAAVDEIRGSIAAADAQHRLAAIERDRQAELVRRKVVAQMELDTAEAQLGEVDGRLAQLKGALARAELALSYTEVTAPFDGLTGISTVDPGALVGPGSGPLVTLMRLDPIEVTFPVATAVYLDHAAHGGGLRDETASLRLPNGTDYDLEGAIDFVGSDVEAGTDSVTMRAIFPNPDGVLLDGALVGVTLRASEAAPVLAIPVRAVQRDREGAFVMVVGAGDKVEQRRVDVARTDRDLAVIASGLADGESVITDGVNKVQPGVVVDAAPEKAG